MSDLLDGFTEKDGLVYRLGRFLGTGAADGLAGKVGLVCAEHVVKVLAFRKTPAGKCFQQRLEAAGPDFYGLTGKQRIRVEHTVAELFHRQKTGTW